MNMIKKDLASALSYDDVFIVPNYSEVSSRKEVDISSTMSDKFVEVPIITANMDSITDRTIAKIVREAGGIAALHRFQSVEEACQEFKEVQLSSKIYSPIPVSIGVNRDSQERARALYYVGAREFVIDIAHGHSKQMKDMIEWMRKECPDSYIIAGNIATPEAFCDLANWGAHAVKVGVGPGAACLTKNVTGVTVPQFTCVANCAMAKDEYNFHRTNQNKVKLIADGGIKEIGDVCKAIGAGADFVMCGKLFASCKEAPGKGIYRGSASADAQTTYRLDKEYVPTPEGLVMTVELKDSAAEVVTHIAGGLRSACSYVGAHTLREFQENCMFGVRHNKS